MDRLTRDRLLKDRLEKDEMTKYRSKINDNVVVHVIIRKPKNGIIDTIIREKQKYSVIFVAAVKNASIMTFIVVTRLKMYIIQLPLSNMQLLYNYESS